VALPFLDAMAPAQTPVRQSAATPKRVSRASTSARRDDGQVDAGNDGRRLRVY
jgi:hypothetical protein